ncbi:MurR/RpiR family transcriptional regulator [Bordetella petrii]|uniref:MurR/RpiR family transcriptional regulator n=1 Tax=Bordetella petrii TaxID=94624 RepID=UPI0005A49FEC|nr:MurR/RpiR family transcriptional regulator [Bordetella petrii]
MPLPSLPLPVQQRLQSLLEQLPPELQRAAHWVADHPAEVGLWSMRRQAQALGVAPATMLRLARAAGYDSYEAFRAPFQQALAGERPASLRERAAELQAAHGSAGAPGHDALTELQARAIQSVCSLNSSAAFDASVKTLLEARQVGFLGTRSAFGIAFQMHYAYQLVRRNSVLIDGLGGLQAETVDNLRDGDALIAISQSPYPSASVRLARQAAQQGVAVIALTDDTLSPLAVDARHVLLFERPDREGVRHQPAQRGPGSFFHTTAGLLGLAEHLIARLTARGGEEVLNRLSEIEDRMHADKVFWSALAGQHGP